MMMKLLRYVDNKKFVRSERGNVIIIFALFLTILLGLGGGVVDLSLSYLARTRMQAAVDSAIAQVNVSMKSKLSNTASTMTIEQTAAQVQQEVKPSFKIALIKYRDLCLAL